MRRGIRAHKDSQRLAAMADSARGTTEISAEDPHAPAKLRAQAWAREWRQEEMKAANRKAKRYGQAKRFESYELRNNNAQIRRLRKRVDEIDAARSMQAPEDIEAGEFTISWSVEDHRVRIYSPKPDAKDARARQSDAMRRFGFRWSRSVGCWQRHASREAWSAAQLAVSLLT